jgi:5-methylcytosine-specific restriction endonuclease McrA
MGIRLSSSWRKRAVNRIAKRDGLACYICSCADKLMVRKGGVSGSYDQGSYYCIAYTTSHFELEHVLPLSEGGSNDDENLRLICHTCHRSKTSSERSLRLKRIFADWRAAQ